MMTQHVKHKVWKSSKALRATLTMMGKGSKPRMIRPSHVVQPKKVKVLNASSGPNDSLYILHVLNLKVWNSGCFDHCGRLIFFRHQSNSFPAQFRKENASAISVDSELIFQSRDFLQLPPRQPCFFFKPISPFKNPSQPTLPFLKYYLN